MILGGISIFATKNMQKTGWTRPPREINDHKRNQKNATKVGFEPRAADHYMIWMDFTIFISVVTEIMEYFIGYLETRVTGSPIGYSEVPCIHRTSLRCSRDGPFA